MLAARDADGLAVAAPGNEPAVASVPVVASSEDTK
jgi:hypothetical protein